MIPQVTPTPRRQFIKAAILAVPLVASLRAAEPLNYAKLLRAIAEVETGGNDGRIGRHGERSQYQIKASVWQQHCPGVSFSSCRGLAAHQIARDHLHWLDTNLGATTCRREFALAWVWNGGLNSWDTRNAARYDYANRVCNLYASA